MMKFKLGLAEKLIEQILELSAEAQIERRKVERSSVAFQSLSGEIVAYGNLLSLLTTLQAAEELDPSLTEWSLRECAVALTH